jgi:hypothetical protein
MLPFSHDTSLKIVNAFNDGKKNILNHNLHCLESQIVLVVILSISTEFTLNMEYYKILTLGTGISVFKYQNETLNNI